MKAHGKKILLGVIEYVPPPHTPLASSLFTYNIHLVFPGVYRYNKNINPKEVIPCPPKKRF